MRKMTGTTKGVFSSVPSLACDNQQYEVNVRTSPRHPGDPIAHGRELRSVVGHHAKGLPPNSRTTGERLAGREENNRATLTLDNGRLDNGGARAERSGPSSMLTAGS
jgi:hypothetical protein